jgi:hypothetical protein
MTGDHWLICSIESGIMAAFANNPDPFPTLTQLHVHSSQRRVSFSRDQQTLPM